MKQLFLLSTILLTLCSCDEVGIEMLTTTKHLVVLPEDKMYDCPLVDRFPDASMLTDIQVAEFIVKLHSSNVRCHNSINAIRKFLEDAKKTTEQGNNSE